MSLSDDIDIDFGPIDDGGEEITRRAHVAEAHSGPVPITDEPRTKLPPASAQQRGGVWHVSHDQVGELPELYPLEPTAVFIANEDPSAISERISAELRDRSIEAHFDTDVAKAKCTTSDGTDFRIRMYRGRGKFSHGIIVEVQRRFGMSMNFHSDTMAILDRAQGKDVPRSFKKNNLPLVSDTEDDYQADGSASLAMVAKMMNSPSYDSQYLGLQILSSLTDVSKMGSSTARIISKELLKPDNEVGSKVSSFISDSKEGDENFNFRTASLTILANAIVSLQGKISDQLREQIEPMLIKDLRAAEKNQRCAFQASRCVEWLISQDNQNITEIDAALRIAVEVGHMRHAALEKQAQKCLGKI